MFLLVLEVINVLENREWRVAWHCQLGKTQSDKHTAACMCALLVPGGKWALPIHWGQHREARPARIATGGSPFLPPPPPPTDPPTHRPTAKGQHRAFVHFGAFST